MKRILQIGNSIAFVSVVFINYLSNTGLMNNTTIGEISGSYRSLFTPAGYTFAIWGVIYFLLFGFVIYQGRSLWSKKVKNDDFVTRTGWWFIVSCIFNSAWVFAWIFEYTGLSCVLILLLLFSLLQIIFKNRMKLDVESLPIITFLWWPFVIYSGWVTVASIANISTYLIKIGWEGFGISDVIWAIILIIIATLINIIVIWKRNMCEFALVGAWALVGIGSANIDNHDIITYTAFISAVLLIIISGIHGIKNFHMSVFKKLKELMVNK